MIPPNESRRSQMQTSRLMLLHFDLVSFALTSLCCFVTAVAQREEEELQRWRETHRVASVHEDPERLGKRQHPPSPSFSPTRCKGCSSSRWDRDAGRGQRQAVRRPALLQAAEEGTDARGLVYVCHRLHRARAFDVTCCLQLKREEQEKRRKQEDEEKLQKMKAEQRQKVRRGLEPAACR